MAHLDQESGTRDGLWTLRRFLLLILVLGLGGTAVELVLAKHTEDPWQWTPLVLIALAMLTLAWHGLAGRSTLQTAASLRVLQVLMLFFVASGFVGIGLHLNGKMEFKRESDPSLSGWRLLVASLDSKMPPPLAPGVMIQMGLLGLAFTYRHPGFSAARTVHEQKEKQ